MMTREARSALCGLVFVLGAFLPTAVFPVSQTPPDLNDALTAARYDIFIDGVSIGSFVQLAGIASGYDVESIQQTTTEEVLVPATRTPPVVTLKRGKTQDMTIWSWHLAALTGQAGARKSCSLVMFNTKGDPIARYHLTDAWPAKVEIGALKAGASEVLVETVTIVAERIERIPR